MNLLVAINKSYIKYLKTLIKSIENSNPEKKFDIYVLHKDLTNHDIKNIQSELSNKIKIISIKISNKEIEKYPVYEKRYPVEIYFRLFASKYLPKNIERVLYLDTDIIVINDLTKLYNIDFENNYYIGATNIRKMMHKFNEFRLGIKKDSAYINTGVLLINLKELRKIDVETKINKYIRKNKRKLMLPDQDIISALYGNKIKLIDNLKYNLGDRGLYLHNKINKNNQIDINWVIKNTVIIHYYGKNKPWNKNYKGILNCFYNDIVDEDKEPV